MNSKSIIILVLLLILMSTTASAALNWTLQATPEESWSSVAYDGNGTYVAVATTGINRIMTSTDGGVTWTARAAPQNNGWYSVTYGNGLFVAVSFDGANRIMTSPDGMNWTLRSAPSGTASPWMQVIYGDSKFVAVSLSGGTYRAMYSSDGITWTGASSLASNYWRGVTYGNGQYVAVADSYANRVATSPNGISWTVHASANESEPWQKVTYAEGRYVAVSNSGSSSSMMTSTDGVNWQLLIVPPYGYREICYGDGMFVSIAYGVPYVATSEDGLTWTSQPIPIAANWKDVIYDGTKFIAVSRADGIDDGDYFRVMTSNEVIEDPEEPVENILPQPFAKYSFNEGLGTVAVDSIGGYNGTIGANAIWSPSGLAGSNALLFNNTATSKVSITDTEAFDLNNQNFSIVVWIEPDVDYDTARMYETVFATKKIASYHNNGWSFGISKVTQSKLFLQMANGASRVFLESPALDWETNVGTWVGVTFDYSTKIATFYRNGAPVGTATYILDGSTAQPNTAPIILFNGGTSTTGHSGIGDEISFYSVALNETQMAEVMRAEEPEQPTSLLTIYVDDFGSDTTGNGTLSNPYASISKALTIPHVQTIYVADGTYSGFEVTKDNIAIISTGDNAVINETSSSISAITVYGKDNVTLDGFQVTGTACGLYLSDATNVTLESIDVHAPSDEGIRIVAVSRNLNLLNCTLHDTGL